jgi:acetyltransferase-like isoleucine patch superfamily enzyme
VVARAETRTSRLKAGLLFRLYLLLIRRESLVWIKVRRWIVNQLLGREHHELWIFPDVYFEGFAGLKLGDYVSFNRGCNITPSGGLIIGNYVSIAHATTILTVEHGIDDPNVPIKYQPVVSRPVTIGNNVWIGARACILAGVSLADGTIVAAGSVVKHSISEENCTIAGVPAKIVKRRG